ncbi:L-rhamnose-binding lectin SML-like isoform X1 [Syngnathus scovelli]|uniref:L-rhamnose-binding lectin SML-like isoform X1 n=1 Tax=Syngnathus scovelli TaxID=161590 RepID=UPI0035CACAD3
MYKCYRLGRVKKMASGCFRLTTAVLLTATCLLLIAVVDSADKITTCDYGDLRVHRLYCDHGVIKVQEALYGRSSSLVCADDNPKKYLANTHCAQPNTANRIKKSCNGKKLCELSLEEFRKPDPCADTFKYLQTNFTCLPAITVVTCEGSVAHLHCDLGQVIYVYGADYGRRDRTTCSYRRAPLELENVDCKHPTDLVAKMCNGKYGCAITASNALFGDPCITIYKYLEISYTCQYPVTRPH